MIINDNDLFYTCSLLELIGRVTRQKRGAVVDILGKKVVAHIYASAETLICEPIAHTADEFIEMYRVPQGEFDNLASCKYEIPDYGTIGKVYARLIEDVAREDLIDSLFQVYASEVSDMISDYNTDFYNQARDYIKEYYIANGDPGGIDLRIPDIRFKGFTGEWERRKLGDVCSQFEYGLNAAATIYDGKNKYIRITDIDDASHRFRIDDITSPDTDLSIADNYKLVTNDLLFARTGASVGKTYLYRDSDGIVYYAGFLIRAKINNEYNAEFIFQNTMTDEYYQFIRITSQRSGQPGVNAQEYADFILMVPEKGEQEKIGNYFRNLDALIALHERKCERLQNVKKSMLEKMFPKKGSNVPEIRFAGFTEPWELRKLGELVDIGDIDHRMPSTVEGGIPYLMTGDFSGVNELDFSNAKLISVEDYQQLSKKIKPEKEDIIFARYASVGAVRFIDFTRDFLISYSCAIIKSGKRIVPEYLYHFLTSKEAQQQIQLGINIGSQANIGIDSMKNNIIIFMPSEAEQHIISNYLSNLDNLITLRQRELEKLKNIKKSMLEKMFV